MVGSFTNKFWRRVPSLKYLVRHSMTNGVCQCPSLYLGASKSNSFNDDFYSDGGASNGQSLCVKIKKWCVIFVPTGTVIVLKGTSYSRRMCVSWYMKIRRTYDKWRTIPEGRIVRLTIDKCIMLYKSHAQRDPIWPCLLVETGSWSKKACYYELWSLTGWKYEHGFNESNVL